MKPRTKTWGGRSSNRPASISASDDCGTFVLLESSANEICRRSRASRRTLPKCDVSIAVNPSSLNELRVSPAFSSDTTARGQLGTTLEQRACSLALFLAVVDQSRQEIGLLDRALL